MNGSNVFATSHAIAALDCFHAALRGYLAGRREVMEMIIASEKLAGNTVKESNARHALAEIEAFECFLSNPGEVTRVVQKEKDGDEH